MIPSGLTRSSEADTRGWGVKRARRVRDIWKKSKKNKRNASRRRKNKVESRNKNIKLVAKNNKNRQGKKETGKKRRWKKNKKEKNQVKRMINTKRQGKRKNRKKNQLKKLKKKKRLGNRKNENKNQVKRMTKKKRPGKRKNRKKNKVKRLKKKKRQGNRKNKKKKQVTRMIKKKRQGKRKNKKKKQGKRKTKRKNNSRRRGKRISKGKKQKNGKNETGVFFNCLEQTVTIMRMWKDVITNFARQSKRIERQTDTGKSKSGKSGLFIPVAMRLREIGGGKMSELSCGGRTDTPGAEQLANLTRFLFDCEDNVKTVCQPPRSLNITAISSCKEKAKEFKSQAQKCVDKTIGNNKTGLFDACDCWTNDNLQEVAEAAKDCKFIKEANDVKNSLRNCTKAFSLCRKYEDEAVTSILVCKSQPEKLQQTVIPGHHQSRKK